MRETYKEIAGSMCDFERFYEDVANVLPLKCRVVEVGVADGRSSIFLAEKLADLGKDFELVMIDSMDYGKSDQLNTIMRNVTKSGLSDRIRIIQGDSLESSCKFPDEWAHFVFIDASHKYEQTKADIRLWYRKVMHGFYLAGHDYNMEPVHNAVTEVIGSRVEVIKTDKDYGIWAVKRNEACF